MPAGARSSIARAPGFDRLQDLVEIFALTFHVIRLALTPPYSWWRDAVVEFSTAFRRCLLPLLLSMVAFAVGIGVLFVGQIVSSLGTSDRLLGALNLGFTREPAVWVSSMIFAGVAGSAMTADLGARRIREELDALDVLGVDKIRSLVVPRVVAMMAIGPVLAFLTILVATAVNYTLIPLFYPSVSYAGSLDALDSFIFSIDVIALLVKAPLIGLAIGIVACHKGLTTSGGAEGVGRAVNQAVVVMFVLIFLVNALVNTAYLALFPSVQELRG